MAWLSGWTRRKKFTIDGTTAGAQTNYQMQLTVHYGSGTDSGSDVYLGGNSQIDFSDIRFTTSDGTTLLDYWIEEKVDSDYALVWVEFDSIPASPDSAVFYIYYGNSSASSASNGANTFIEFDDFDDNSLNTAIWDEYDGYGTDGSVSETNQRLEITTGSGTEHGVKTDNTYSFSSGRRYRIFMYEPLVNNGDAAIFYLCPTVADGSATIYSSESNWLRFMIYQDGGGGQWYYFQKKVDGTVTTINSESAITDLDRKVEILIDGTNVTLLLDGVTWQLKTAHGLNFTAPYIYPVRYGAGTSNTCHYDNFFIGNYSDPEPTWGTWGSEELGIQPVSTPSAFSAGKPKLNLTIQPISTPSGFSAGTPTIIMGAIIIQPVSAPSAFSAGKPTLVYPQVLQPVSTPSAFSAGTPTVVLGGFIIQPASTPSAFSAGKPAIIKYVWHVILDARYLTVSPDTNRLLVIGRHDDGYEVFGSHSDSDEIDLVGERLDFIPEPAIPTDSQAAEVAQAVLKKLRLTTNRGVILIPPNCGQELWDVIQVQDSPTAQQAQKYRVIGIRLEYHPRRARYAHTLILGSP